MEAPRVSVDSSPPDKLSIVVFSGTFERVHYALVMAAAAAASNTPVTLFFTMGGAKALLAPDLWRGMPSEDGRPAGDLDHDFQTRGVAGFEELLSACVALGVTVMVCEMGLRALNLHAGSLRPDVPVSEGGVVSFLADASRDGGMLFV
ncbi:MAG: DsrE family protein [Rhodospirillales bacterium]|nr:DsrE family protein [Rhodospirillales bacterium]